MTKAIKHSHTDIPVEITEMEHLHELCKHAKFPKGSYPGCETLSSSSFKTVALYYSKRGRLHCHTQHFTEVKEVWKWVREQTDEHFGRTLFINGEWYPNSGYVTDCDTHFPLFQRIANAFLATP